MDERPRGEPSAKPPENRLRVRQAGWSRSSSSIARARRRRVWALAAAGAALAAGVVLWLRPTEVSWRDSIADARVQVVTDEDAVEQAAAVSRDGRFVAFLSDRDGKTDVWVTEVGAGRPRNLTRGSAPELVDPSVRTLGFSPDGSLVTYWVRRPDGSKAGAIDIWAVPTGGGEPRPYVEGAAELAWTAPAGLDAHFPAWAPDRAYVYFVQGSLPDGMDVWRIRPEGGPAERITSENARVSHPVLLDRRTLLYLATDPDGSGPWLYTMDVERRSARRLTAGLDRFTSLSGSADGRRLVVTVARPRRTLWRLPIGGSPVRTTAPAPITLTTGNGFAPRFGPGYLLFGSATGTSESLWKLASGSATELWKGEGARIIGGPAIASDGRVAFSLRQQGQVLLYVMRADGTDAQIVADRLALRGAPAWAPDGRSITTGADDQGTPRLFRVPLDGTSPSPFVPEYSVDPVWAPDGRFVVYSGPDVGATFALKAATTEAAEHPLPALILPRGARRVAFLPGRRSLVHLRGEIQHKDLWLIDLDTGAERRLTRLPDDFDVADFDVSPDGREVVLERRQEQSDILVMDLPRP